jgi:GNAT superfamily N-acetyltransferase
MIERRDVRASFLVSCEGVPPIVQSMTVPSGFIVRSARPSELMELVRLDDQAGALYEQAGLPLLLASDHPFVVEECLRWAAAIEKGWGRVVATQEGELAAFAIFGEVDEKPYLDQLSVLPAFMRRGLGRALVEVGVDWAGDRELWLTTYAHLPWNAVYYRRLGFEPVPDAACGPELLAFLRSQRAVLPQPEQRTAMVRIGHVAPG